MKNIEIYIKIHPIKYKNSIENSPLKSPTTTMLKENSAGKYQPIRPISTMLIDPLKNFKEEYRKWMESSDREAKNVPDSML